MDDRKLNFGPRYSPELDWVNPDGTSADKDDIGLEVSLTEDDGLTISLGSQYRWQSWPQGE